MTDTYPNEAWPSDGAAEALDGTTDQKTGLPYIAKGTNPTSTPSYQVQYQRREQRQNAMLATLRQGQVVDEGGLYVGVYPIDYTLGGVRKHFAGAMNQAMTDNATKCVYLDASNALQVQDAFPSDLRTCLPLAEVTASGGVVTIADRRPWTSLAVAEFTGSIDGASLSAELADRVPYLEISVGDEYSNSIWVTVQAKDAGGGNLSERMLIRGWVGDSQYGGEIATPPNTDFTLQTGTQVKELTTNKHLLALSNDNGRVVFDVQDTGSRTFYLMAELDGRVYASEAITFA
ncbi:MAG: hypothetical protein JXQ73_17635 [Phycisphaerae bacterium]|nr:hypothetical protein [Phycisphaerae bacterium]